MANRMPTIAERPISLTGHDVYLFREGTHSRLYERLGAHVLGDGTQFAVWAPNAAQVAVIGDFNGWDPRGQGRPVRLPLRGAAAHRLDGLEARLRLARRRLDEEPRAAQYARRAVLDLRDARRLVAPRSFGSEKDSQLARNRATARR